NPSFKVTGGKKFWMGTNYRTEWKTPITVPIIRMSTEKGGLTPVKRGGGKQTKSLRLEDPTGTQYSFRSIQKFITGKSLPLDLQSEAAEDLVADGVSASYPYAALSIPPLAKAAGVPSLDVKVVYIPDDPKLGEYREDFKNLLAYFENRLPDSVTKSLDTDELVAKLKDDNDHEVDQYALLKARILDMFIMDLDRHEDQWQWGVIDKDKGNIYYPIPRDRDQAFFINRGVIPGIVKWPWLVPQVQGFDAKAKNINRFNFAARNLDRFFLNELNEQDWRKAVNEFLPKMTDEVIETAINQQPPEIRPISGDFLITKLKERRQHLAAEVMEYYRFLSEHVSITGSDKKELFDITRGSDGSVQLKIYKITNEGEQSTLMYDRTFDPQVTEELRLYGFGGDDRFVVRGTQDKIKLRLIGGDGEDNFEAIDNKNGGIVYDLKSENNKITGDFRNKMKNDTIVNSFDRLGYKYNQTIPFLSANYNRDDGLYLGFMLRFINHGFRKDPYKNMHQFNIVHALSTKAFNIRYYAEYISVFGKKTDLLTDIDIKAPNNTTNFFGYGDADVDYKSKPGSFRYYRAKYNLGDISLLIRKRFSDKVSIILGPTYEFYKLDSTDNAGRNIVTNIPGVDKATLFAKQSFFGGKVSLIVDTRDNQIVPQKGINWLTSYRYLPGLNDESTTLQQLNSELTFYIKLAHNKLTFANRVGGGVNFGDDFEFFQAQYLGGDEHLRGYRKYRFAGKSKIFNQAEIRWALANFRTYLFPAAFGILAFYDTGKIYDQNDNSNKWLNGYGGGIWISPLKRMVFTVSYTVSKEDKLPLIGLGWKF
ncbi:MAG TPA: hypothetical protein VFH08_09020, partial [Chitinophagaceae bacterium]|nr:hypothetical protein [Chitinophagaceae bacterium]